MSEPTGWMLLTYSALLFAICVVQGWRMDTLSRRIDIANERIGLIQDALTEDPKGPTP